MGKRTRVITATIVGIIGIVTVALPAIGGNSLNAAGLQGTGFDISKYLVWGGIAILVFSALLFVSASSD